MHDEVSVVSGEACRALLRLLIKCSCDACRPRKTKSLRADVPPSPLESAHPAKNRVNPADTGDLGCTTRNCTVDVKRPKNNQPDTHERSNRKSRNPVRFIRVSFRFPGFPSGCTRLRVELEASGGSGERRPRGLGSRGSLGLGGGGLVVRCAVPPSGPVAHRRSRSATHDLT